MSIEMGLALSCTGLSIVSIILTFQVRELNQRIQKLEVWKREKDKNWVKLL
jgi:hypothetical protein